MTYDFVTDEMHNEEKIPYKTLILKVIFNEKKFANLLFNLSLTKQHRLLGLRPAGSYGPIGPSPRA